MAIRQGLDNPYSVGQVNNHMKRLIDGDRQLKDIYVEGELSNYKRQGSGHHYFSMKDDTGSIRCVMFNGDSRIDFKPENGMKVIAFGSVSVFTRDGAYQIYVQRLVPVGAGVLHIEFEKLKKRLEAEGLFDQAHKKRLPKIPKTIGVVTSGSGAALQDILRVLKARWPMSVVKLLPVRVQGVQCPEEVSRAIAYADKWNVADVLIVGRGGGSMEDLWGFNDERVARAIYAAKIPVISAVGHEPDFTISDFVADQRAATPSNGAELAVPDQRDVREFLNNMDNRLVTAIQHKLKSARTLFDHYTRNRVLIRPLEEIVYRRQNELDYMQNKLAGAMTGIISYKRAKLERITRSKYLLDPLAPVKANREIIDRLSARMNAAEQERISRLQMQLLPKTQMSGFSIRLTRYRHALEQRSDRLQHTFRTMLQRYCDSLRVADTKLDALSPLRVLSRGYAYVQGQGDGKVISSVQSVLVGDSLQVRLADGVLNCQVLSVGN